MVLYPGPVFVIPVVLGLAQGQHQFALSAVGFCPGRTAAVYWLFPFISQVSGLSAR